MATNITYNGKNLPDPLPIVSREDIPIRYGENWGEQYRYTLEGYLINCSGYSELINQQQALLNIFNKDFQELTITDDDVNVSHSVCVIENINFGASDYLYNVPYSISLATYNQSSFIENGVLEPTDSWEFSETEERLVTLSHDIGARGFNTSSAASNGLRNAINFVHNRTGLNNQPSLQFITGAGDFLLKSQVENIDRLNGTYSISERYTQDQTSAGLVKRYAVDISSGLQGFINVNINGTIEGGIDSSITEVRDEYFGLDIFSIVSGIYTGATTNYDLNINPLSSGITEDPFRKVLTFSLDYDNNPSPLISLDYNVDVQDGEDATVINVNGNVIGRGEMSKRWSDIQSHFATQVDLYALAQSGYYWNGGAYSVNPQIVSSGSTYDQYRGTISFQAVYDDRETPPANFKDFDYTISFKPSIRQVRATSLFGYTPTEYLPLGSEENYITDLGYYNKVEMTINGTATLEKTLPTEASISLVEKEIENLFFQYSNDGAIRTNKQISFLPPFGQQISFNYSWVFGGPPVNDTGNYGLILNLNTKT